MSCSGAHPPPSSPTCPPSSNGKGVVSRHASSLAALELSLGVDVYLGRVWRPSAYIPSVGSLVPRVLKPAWLVENVVPPVFMFFVPPCLLPSSSKPPSVFISSNTDFSSPLSHPVSKPSDGEAHSCFPSPFPIHAHLNFHVGIGNTVKEMLKGDSFATDNSSSNEEKVGRVGSRKSAGSSGFDEGLGRSA